MSATNSTLRAVPVNQQQSGSLDVPSNVINKRRSKELVIAFAGPVGCGVDVVKGCLMRTLENSGYHVRVIKISDYLKSCIATGVVKSVKSDKSTGAQRYIDMQDAGNELREAQADILAEHAISEIAKMRGADASAKNLDITDFEPSRTAYIIDQLKHHEEVSLLRTVYGNLFYMFGILSTAPRRELRLKDEGVEPNRISDLVERDRKQRESNGQQLDKTLQLADFFVRNDSSNIEVLEGQVKRFVDLIHGANGISPTKEEYGMYVAYAAGLRSSCLSRQVGASIMNKDGVIVATGRNDVPKPGGGLYGPEDGSDDARCVKLENGRCHNDFYKTKLVNDIESVVAQEIESYVNALGYSGSMEDARPKIDFQALAKKISRKAQSETRLGGLIEFSRSIHAEMDAIVSLAANGNGKSTGGTLFTYTFPCHNCARHIVAAGIKTVYFLEPYEKSLALDLHSDAIQIDGVSNTNNSAVSNAKVKFVHFEGVAPRQYLNMFTPAGERKDKAGVAVKFGMIDATKKVPAYLDSYREYELKVVEHLEDLMKTLRTQGEG